LVSYRWAVRGASIAAVLASWQVVGLSVDPVLLSYPTQVLGAFISLSTTTTFIPDLLSTIGDFLVGFAIAAVLGVLLGMAMARWQTVETALDPYVSALYSTPYVALAPLFVIWLGIGIYSQLAVVILSALFVILLNTFAGVKNLNKTFVETGRAFGFKGFGLYRRVVLPGALPYIITGLRLGIGRGFVGIIVAELLVRLDRLGFLMVYYSELLEISPGLAIAVTLGLLGLAMTEVLKRAENQISSWRTTATGG
jgi:ABC-type nitrate/sulfonate/bicarbonate transport system permease component